MVQRCTWLGLGLGLGSNPNPNLVTGGHGWMEKGPASDARKEPGGIMALSGAEYVTKAAIAANWGQGQARRWGHAAVASWTTLLD